MTDGWYQGVIYEDVYDSVSGDINVLDGRLEEPLHRFIAALSGFLRSMGPKEKQRLLLDKNHREKVFFVKWFLSLFRDNFII